MPNHPTALGLATMASTGFELGGSAAEVARDIDAMWRHLGRPAGAFSAAAAAVGALPQRPEVPVADMARRQQFEAMVGMNPVEVELAAALSARELLERMAEGQTSARS